MKLNYSHNASPSMPQGYPQAKRKSSPLLSLLPIVLLAVAAAGLGSPALAVGADSAAEGVPVSDTAPSSAEDGFAFEVQSYEEDFGVSAQTAERNLQTQQNAIGVVEGLEHALALIHRLHLHGCGSQR
jgi:hypothetical protein